LINLRSTPLEDLDQVIRLFEGIFSACLADVAQELQVWPQLSRSRSSGGSFTAAHYAAYLHERFLNVVAKAVTPLEAVQSICRTRGAAVMLLTAGGSNPDALGALRHIAEAEPKRLAVLCARKKTPLAALAKEWCGLQLVELELPVSTDGFLATNSLLAFTITLIRAYVNATAANLRLPDGLAAILHPHQTPRAFLQSLAERSALLWKRETLLVLYGPDTHTAACDLESRFTEAALGVVQLADYRNFAHGRHHWLAKRGASSAVLALATPTEEPLAQRTLALIPRSVPTLLLSLVHSGIEGSLAALLVAFYLTELAGQIRGIDPGRPGVPLFGRRIYNLNAFNSKPTVTGFPRHQAIAIERKARLSADTLQNRGELGQWLHAYQEFVDQLATKNFTAIILDYDGTLCDTRFRDRGIAVEAADELARIAGAGLTVGIVTGRGGSVARDLRRRIRQELWDRFVIGYYNGSDVAPLNKRNHPQKGSPVDVLQEIVRTFEADPTVGSLFKWKCKPCQITIIPSVHVPAAAVWEVLQRLTLAKGEGVRIVRSAHSVDVLAPGVSKCRLIDQLHVVKRAKT
jgi:hypothetical protein